MSDPHELISKLKDLAIELGRTPTSQEFENSGRGMRYKVGKSFGTYSALIQAADLEPAPGSRVKIDSSVFRKSIATHLESYEPKEKHIRESKCEPYAHLACINDIHWPFHAQRVIDRFYRYIDDHKPEYVILDGDARDMYSHSKFPRSHNLFTPKEESELGRKLNVEFWAEILRLHPKAKCYQLMGNHDVRPLKRILETYPAAENWIEEIIQREFTFEGVKTIFDQREELMLPGDILIHHGHSTALGAHRDYSHYNVIVGHTHRPGIVYRQLRGVSLWEMNTGYAGDPEAKGLSYTPQKITNWVQSFGVVDPDGPRVIVV